MGLMKYSHMPRKIICRNIWRERKVCITFALANDKEADASERGRSRAKVLKKTKADKVSQTSDCD